MLPVSLLFFYGLLLRLGLCTTRYDAPFGCLTKLILTDQNRTEALGFINGIREDVATGHFPNVQHTASLMNKLAWDCDLEIVAQTAVTMCPETPQIKPSENAMNYRYFPRSAPAMNLTHPLQSALQEWTTLQAPWPADNIFNGNPLLLSFANLIHGNTTAVGCGGAICAFGSAAACVFTQPDVKNRELVYMLGRPCQNGQHCKGPLDGVCENGLCVISMWTSTTSAPTTTTTTPTTTTSTTTTTTTLNTTTSSTTTPNTTTSSTTTPNTTTSSTTTPNTTTSSTTTPNSTTSSTATATTTTTTTTTTSASTDCPSKAFSSAFRKLALQMHNNFRSLVARGLAQNGPYSDKNTPPASRMNLMEYDCNAEKLALEHARLCDGQLSPPHARPNYKENIHILRMPTADLMGAIESAISTFTGELAASGIPSNMLFTRRLFKRRHRRITRVSKVLWGSNRHVGCASHLCDGFYFTSCMYRKPSNVFGESIYPVGEVCSTCPSGPKDCDRAVGLCPN